MSEKLTGRDPLTRDLLVYALGAEGRGRFRANIAKAESFAVRAIDPLQLVE